jgi:hypothetical protein
MAYFLTIFPPISHLLRDHLLREVSKKLPYNFLCSSSHLRPKTIDITMEISHPYPIFPTIYLVRFLTAHPFFLEYTSFLLDYINL